MPTIEPTSQKTRVPATLEHVSASGALAEADQIFAAEPSPPSAGNSVEDWIADLNQRAKTLLLQLTHLQAVVQAINTGSRFVWESPTDLDYDGGFRIGLNVLSSATTFSDPRHPIVATRSASNTHIDAKAPRGFDPALMRVLVTRSGSVAATIPGDGQEWNIIQGTGSPEITTWQIQDSHGAVDDFSFRPGDSFQLQIARVAHELEIPLEALEDGGAVDGSLMLFDEGWTAGGSIIDYLLVSLRQSRWRGEWAAGTFLDDDLCEYESKFYLRNGAGSDSGAQNPTANSSWQEVTISDEPLEYWVAQRMKAIASIHDSGQVEEDLHDALDQNTWRGEWQSGTPYAVPQLVKYAQTPGIYYERKTPGTDSPAQNPVANAGAWTRYDASESDLMYWVAYRMDKIAQIDELADTPTITMRAPASAAIVAGDPVIMDAINGAPEIKLAGDNIFDAGRKLLGIATDSAAAGDDVEVLRFGLRNVVFAGPLTTADQGKPVYLSSYGLPFWTLDISASLDHGRIHGVLMRVTSTSRRQADVLWDFEGLRQPDSAPWARAEDTSIIPQDKLPAEAGGHLQSSESIGYEPHGGYAYLLSSHPGTIWGTPNPAPLAKRAQPLHWRELGSDDTRPARAGQYDYTYQTAARQVITSRQAVALNTPGFAGLDGNGNPSGFDNTKPGYGWSGATHRWLYNQVAFTDATAGTTQRYVQVAVSVDIDPNEWHEGDTLQVQWVSADGRDYTPNPVPPITFRLHDTGNQKTLNDRFYVRITPDGVFGSGGRPFYLNFLLTPGDGRATTTRTILEARVSFVLPFVGQYPVQSLHALSIAAGFPETLVVDDNPSGYDSVRIGRAGDDDRTTVDLEIQADGHYLEAGRDMRQVALRFWASAQPSSVPSGAEIRIYTWLPGLLAPQVLGKLALDDTNWLNSASGLQGTAHGVLKGQRFAVVIADASHTPTLAQLGAPIGTWDVNVDSSDQPRYVTLVPGLLRTHQILAEEQATSQTDRAIPAADMPAVDPRAFQRIVVVVKDGNDRPCGTLEWPSQMQDLPPLTDFATSGGYASGSWADQSGNLHGLRFGVKADGSAILSTYAANVALLGAWIEYLS